MHALEKVQSKNSYKKELQRINEVIKQIRDFLIACEHSSGVKIWHITTISEGTFYGD